MAEQKRRSHNTRFIFIIVSLFLVVLNLFLMFFSLFMETDFYLSKVLIPLPVDETAPTIRIKGPEKISVAVGTKYTDDGVDAYDDRTETIVETNNTVDINTIGDYTITYTATDEHGNSSTATRLVSVVQPTGTIFLTFDDGPGPFTNTLLDILKKYNVPATFFVTGAGDDSLIKREFDEGHAIALHSYTHNYSYIYSSVANYYEDLANIQDRVTRITGQPSYLIRFPGGSSNTVSTRYDGRSHIMSFLTQDVLSHGYYYFDWNVNSGDADTASTSDAVYSNVINGLKVGGDSVVLQHDIKGYSVDAVERIIQYALEHGFIFSKLDNTSFSARHGVNN